MPRATLRHARGAALLLGALLSLALPLPGRAACRHGAATLRCAGRRARVRVGVGYTYQPEKPDEAALVTREFDALTLEGELLWSVVHPEATRWNFAPADRAVAWAARHGLYVTATHFVWDQLVYASTPAWVKAIDDPERLRVVMRQHLATITHRYGRRVRRWIVVNEPLRYFGDTAAIQDNHFSRVLGPDWIAESFRIAHRAAPHASLWLNEVFTETDARKAQALVELARTLVTAHVPIDGVKRWPWNPTPSIGTWAATSVRASSTSACAFRASVSVKISFNHREAWGAARWAILNDSAIQSGPRTRLK